MTTRLRALSRDEVRRLDIDATGKLGLPSLLLMENAGRGAAGWLAELVGAIRPDAGGRIFSPSSSTPGMNRPRGPTLPVVLVVCGPGNNGGDGAVLARHLDAWSFPVRVVWLAAHIQLQADATVQAAILEKSGVDQSAWFDIHPGASTFDAGPFASLLAEADWLVDGLLGTGLSRPVEGPMRAVIEAMNSSGKPIFAIDIPSGLDADSGQPSGTSVRAAATATFVASKLGFTALGAVDYTGDVAVIDIGLPRCLLQPYFDSPSTATQK